MMPGGQIHRIAGGVARHWRAARDLLAVETPALGVIRRYFSLFAGREEVGVDALVAAAACIVAEAGHQMTNDAGADDAAPRRANGLVMAYLDNPQRFVPPPLLAGDDIVRTLPQMRGAQIGRILRAVRAAQLAGEIATHADALTLARQLAAEGSH
jgi:poly(A) polymerase/tRNA nucleotidyltransferase (CCA-adding enzyme)